MAHQFQITWRVLPRLALFGLAGLVLFGLWHDWAHGRRASQLTASQPDLVRDYLAAQAEQSRTLKARLKVDQPVVLCGMPGCAAVMDERDAGQAVDPILTSSTLSRLWPLARIEKPAYRNVFIMLDMTAVVGVPDSHQGVDTMRDVFDPVGNGKGCAHACHDGLHKGRSGRTAARNAGVALREDRIRHEISRLIQAIAVSAGAGRVRFDLSTFSRTRSSVQTLTTNYSRAVQALDRMMGFSSRTHIDGPLKALLEVLPNGKADLNQINTNEIIVITDGFNTSQSSGNHEQLQIQPVDAHSCALIKETGARLTIVHLMLPDDILAEGSTASVQAREKQAMARESLRACASPTHYHQAVWGADISYIFDALKARLSRPL